MTRSYDDSRPNDEHALATTHPWRASWATLLIARHGGTSSSASTEPRCTSTSSSSSCRTSTRRRPSDWVDSLDQVVEQEGETRARFLLFKLLKRARQLQVGLPPLTQTRYINTISPEQEP